MNEYSKIVGWRIKNFRNLGDVYIDFTESPIITLLGDNEAGKTSVIKTFAVLGCNGYGSEQKSYIRDGFEGFGIACSLENGTKIYRFKRTDSNYYTIEKPGQPPINISKIDRGYGTPVEVEKVMGFVIEPETKEILQVRTYEDQLLFVLTKASENYKVMYNALKVENLTKAISAGNIEANEAKKTINSCEASIETLQESIRNIRIVDISNASKLKERIKAESTRLARLEKALNLIERQHRINSELGCLVELDKASEISEVEAYRLSRLSDVIEKNAIVQSRLSKYTDMDKLGSIDTTEIYKLRRGIDLLYSQGQIELRLTPYKSITEASIINTELVDKLKKVIDKVSHLNNLESKVSIYSQLGEPAQVNHIDTVNRLKKIMGLIESNKIIESEILSKNNDAESYYEDIKHFGVIVTECPNCGETVIVDKELV